MTSDNTPACVQRVIEIILRPERDLARAYVDDILIFSNLYNEHLKHLEIVFTKLLFHNIHLSPKNRFLSYSSLALLGQRPDVLRLSEVEYKLQATSKLAFPHTLKRLKYYLGLTLWHRQVIDHCAKRTAALQARKI